MFHPIKSAARLIKRVIYTSPRIKNFLARYPRFFLFIRKRFTPDEKFGLYLTIGAILTAFFIYLFFGFIGDLIGQSPLTEVNSRIIKLVQFFRIPLFSNVMLFFGYLGKRYAIFFGVLVLSMVFVIFRRWYYLMTLMVAMGGGEIFVWMMSYVAAKPGNPLFGSLAPEAKYDFLGVHSFIAFTFYGLVTYFFFKVVRGKFWKLFSVILGVIVIGAIGFSRVIYPEASWPTDVFASYASGAAWLTTLITALELRNFKINRLSTVHLRKFSVELLGVALFLVWSFYVVYSFQSNALNPKPKEYKKEFAILEDSLDKNLFSAFPATSDDIIGVPTKPINIIIVGEKEKLDEAFGLAGWLPSDPLTIKNLWHMASSLISKEPYLESPAVPTFWNGRPDDFSYVQPTRENPLTERHHIPFWKTPFVFNDGSPVWFGSAHFDKVVKLKSGRSLPIHNIDPTVVDNSRDKIKDDLVKTGIIENLRETQIIEVPETEDVIGGQFLTDGKAYVLYLKK